MVLIVSCWLPWNELLTVEKLIEWWSYIGSIQSWAHNTSPEYEHCTLTRGHEAQDKWTKHRNNTPAALQSINQNITSICRQNGNQHHRWNQMFYFCKPPSFPRDCAVCTEWAERPHLGPAPEKPLNCQWFVRALSVLGPGQGQLGNDRNLQMHADSWRGWVTDRNKSLEELIKLSYLGCWCWRVTSPLLLMMIAGHDRDHQSWCKCVWRGSKLLYY